ncbi:unnamed protein product, partial [Porites evermanni]
NDTWSCDQSKPCKTISRAVELASSGDHILLDGNNTDKDPYNCQSMPPELSGVQINKSLSIMGYGSPMPHIQCNKGAGLQFNGSNNEQQMNVTLSRLLVSQSSIMVQDSSVRIDGCRFERSKGVVINIRSRLILNILVRNSIFYNNSACISVVVNSTKKQSKKIQVVFKMRNSSFLYSNVRKDMGKCISFTESQNSSQSVSCDITLEHTTFSGNKFILPQGLISLEINNGSQSIQFKSVTFFDNDIPSTREDLIIDSVLCIVRGTDVNISISSSKFSSEYAKVLNGSAEDISFHIYNSTFRGHRGRANGGVISLQGTNLCKLNVSKSSFANTSAVVGGAISIECFIIDAVSLNQNNFTNNTASNVGGALYIKAFRASVVLRHLTFTNCKTFSVAGSGVLIDNRLESRNRKPENELVLTVENCHFEECVTEGDMSIIIGGSLTVFYKTQININISNSNFISNYGALTIAPFPNLSELTANTGSKSIKKSYVKIQNTIFLHNSGLIIAPVLIYVSNQSVVIFQNVTMESNKVFSNGLGGAAYVGIDCFLTIQKCRFSENTGDIGGGALYVAVNSLIVKDSFFVGNKVSFLGAGDGGALFVFRTETVVIFNTIFRNCSGSSGGAISAVFCGNITIKKSQFVENNAGYVGEQGFGGGAINLMDCQVIFEETRFQRNTGLLGGAVYLQSGSAAFKNCYAVDNFATAQGGFLYGHPAGMKNVVIQDSALNQTITGLKNFGLLHKEASFIHGSSIEELKIFNTTMESTPYDSNGLLLLVTNVTVMDFGKDNSTILNCPVGNEMEILSFTTSNYHTAKSTFAWQFSCSACTGNSYSLQRGRAVGSYVVPGFQCLPCPFGANCSQNIVAKPNFWGFKETIAPPTLKFTTCPVGYCSPPNKTEFPKYNGCQGNRSDKLCGHCSDAYSETLYSAACRPSNECNDYWFWPVALVYVSLMAFYLTFKPPIIPWIMRQIKWFKTNDTPDGESKSDGGYVKIIFYFYQAADLLLASNTSLRFVEGKSKDILVGVFSFRQSFSSNGLICPFPGLTVVTKQLFSASYVFGTCLMIGVFYFLHKGVQRCRKKEAPTFSPYMAGILQTMLLGYKTLASVSFELLRCVPIGSEKLLFLDGNIVCFQWWQYILIAYVVAFVMPFVFVLILGCYKLHNGSLSVTKFPLACFFPFPFLLYWLFLFLVCVKRNAAQTDTATRRMSNRSVETTLFGCFKKPAEGSTLSLSWESVMIGRRLILILLKTFVNDPMPRLLIMSFLCVLFLQHHSMTQPFRDVIANRVETISLLSLVLLGVVNMFFASFVSLAVPATDRFKFWWYFCEVVETIILCAVPAIISIFVINAALSLVIRFLRACFRCCYSKVKQSEDMRPLLSWTN